jgi:hypothetical protein
MLFPIPILFIIFNRTDTSFRVFEEIKKIKPQKLYLFSDAPRSNVANELEKCLLTREIILKNIDWDCDCKTNFQQVNTGARYAIGNAVNWLFENEEYGIILEHDCLPNSSFFYFCEKLLIKYQFDERVMHIGGNNFLEHSLKLESDYYFSRFSLIWGWATWKRAWKPYYDVEMENLPQFVEQNILGQVFLEINKRKTIFRFLEMTLKKQLNTWDYQWSMAIWSNHGLSICPSINLVKNIGFDADAIHTKNPNHPLSNLPTYSLEVHKHPLFMAFNDEADEKTYKKLYYVSSYGKFKYRIKQFVLSFIKSIKN